jgi:SAM-dependent methyltransferase
VIKSSPARSGALPAAAAQAPAGPDGTSQAFRDWRFAPNIGQHADIYEIENRAFHQAGHVLTAMRALASWAGRAVVDLGCGTGFWLPVYAADASQVIGIEPDPALRAAAGRRVDTSCRAAGPPIDVLAGSAEHIPLTDNSVDLVHARFAYFFPPGTEAGLAEVLRVLKPGGRLIVVDNDYRWGQFADLLSAAAVSPPPRTAATTDQWWADRGATRHEVRSEFRFASREDLAAVLHIEFPPEVADAWLSRHPEATWLTYGYVLFTVTA